MQSHGDKNLEANQVVSLAEEEARRRGWSTADIEDLAHEVLVRWLEGIRVGTIIVQVSDLEKKDSEARRALQRLVWRVQKEIERGNKRFARSLPAEIADVSHLDLLKRLHKTWALMDALGNLSKEDRRMFLARWRGSSVQEISDMENISPQRVSERILRACLILGEICRE